MLRIETMEGSHENVEEASNMVLNPFDSSSDGIKIVMQLNEVNLPKDHRWVQRRDNTVVYEDHLFFSDLKRVPTEASDNRFYHTDRISQKLEVVLPTIDNGRDVHAVYSLNLAPGVRVVTRVENAELMSEKLRDRLLRAHYLKNWRKSSWRTPGPVELLFQLSSVRPLIAIPEKNYDDIKQNREGYFLSRVQSDIDGPLGFWNSWVQDELDTTADVREVFRYVEELAREIRGYGLLIPVSGLDDIDFDQEMQLDAERVLYGKAVAPTLLPSAPSGSISERLVRQSLEYVASLDPLTRSVIYDYIGHLYDEMNESLGSWSKVHIKKSIVALQNAIVGASAPRIDTDDGPQWVVRGVKAENLDEVETTGDAFISTTYGDPISDFSGATCCLMQIYLPDGFPYLVVEDNTARSEREIILPRSTELQLMGREVVDLEGWAMDMGVYMAVIPEKGFVAYKVPKKDRHWKRPIRKLRVGSRVCDTYRIENQGAVAPLVCTRCDATDPTKECSECCQPFCDERCALEHYPCGQ